MKDFVLVEYIARFIFIVNEQSLESIKEISIAY